MFSYLAFTLYIATSFVIYRRAYNPLIIGAFIVIFQFGIGKLIRDVGFGFSSDLYTELLIITYLLGVLLGVTLISKNRVSARPRSSLKVLNDNEHFVALILLLISTAFILSSLISAGSEFGFSGLRAFYHKNRADAGLSIFFISIGILGPILALSCLQTKRYITLAICILCLILIGKKAPFFAICIGYIYLNSIEGKLMRKILILGVMVFLLLMYHNVSSTVEGTPLSILAGYFDYYQNLAHVLEKADLGIQSSLTHGEIFFSQFYSFIPRIFWSGKPEIYGHLLIHERIFPAELITGYTRGIGSTLAVPFMDGGLIWLFACGITKGVITALLYYHSLTSSKYQNYSFILLLLGVSVKVIGMLLLISLISKYTKYKIVTSRKASAHV